MKESKYQPLQDHLSSLKHNRWDASFEEIESILGFSLPMSAHTYAEWWANEDPSATTHTQSRAWMLAGWKTENVNPAGQKLTFVKEK